LKIHGISTARPIPAIWRYLEWKVKVMSLLHEQSEKLQEQQETSVGKGREGHGVRSAWRLGQWMLLDVEVISGVSGIVFLHIYVMPSLVSGHAGPAGTASDASVKALSRAPVCHGVLQHSEILRSCLENWHKSHSDHWIKLRLRKRESGTVRSF